MGFVLVGFCSLGCCPSGILSYAKLVTDRGFYNFETTWILFLLYRNYLTDEQVRIFIDDTAVGGTVDGKAFLNDTD